MQFELLSKINSPKDIRGYSNDELLELCNEIRSYTIDTITEIGGHLAPTLGVVELSVALHHVFDTPKDKLVWDVGHQGYAHKLLTGRYNDFKTIHPSPSTGLKNIKQLDNLSYLHLSGNYYLADSSF